MSSSAPLRIIATGGHSGLGLEAIKTLLASPFAASGCQVTLLARDDSAPRVTAVRQRLVEQVAKLSSDKNTSIELQHMDLASLQSVRYSADVVAKKLEAGATGHGTDIFLLNAAVAKATKQTVVDQDRATNKLSYPADAMTNDANSTIETTACVNHIAHLLFVKLLLPTILQNAASGRKVRLVFTGSALHRSLKHIDSLDTFFGASTSIDMSAKWTLRETYAASKFLQMLGIRALQRKMEARIRQQGLGIPAGSIEIVVVQPGFVPQTGLSRETGLISRLAMTYLLPWAPFATTLDDAGSYIAQACCIDLDSSNSLQRGADDTSNSFGSTDAIVGSALLEVKSKKQRFGVADERTADPSLQEKWWPSACGEV